MNRRRFFATLFGAAVATRLAPASVVQPAPRIILSGPTIPTMIGGINQATFTFWRNQQLVGGLAGGGKTAAMLADVRYQLNRAIEKHAARIERETFRHHGESSHARLPHLGSVIRDDIS